MVAPTVKQDQSTNFGTTKREYFKVSFWPLNWDIPQIMIYMNLKAFQHIIIPCVHILFLFTHFLQSCLWMH